MTFSSNIALAIARTVATMADIMSADQCREAASKLRTLEGDPEVEHVYSDLAYSLDQHAIGKDREESS